MVAVAMLAVVVIPTVVNGQVPGVPAAAPVAAAPAGAAEAAGAVKPGILMRCCAALEECKRKCCATPLGAMINGMIAPASAITGGVIPSFCPTVPGAKDLAEPGVGGAAAAAKKEAAEAKARRESVRFLGTVDCRYFPGTAKALATALRVDSSECVRFEAALVLGHGCCCSEITIKALEASVSGMEIDGNPAERSARVRCAAAIALEKCLSCYSPPYEEPEPKQIKEEEAPAPGEVKPGTLPTPKAVKDDIRKTENKTGEQPGLLTAQSRQPRKQTVEHARQILADFHAMMATAQGGVPTPPPGAVAGRKSLFQLIKDTEFEGPLVYSPLEAAPTTAPTTATPALLPTPALMPTPAPVVLTQSPMPAPTQRPASMQTPAPIVLAMPTKLMDERGATLAAPKSSEALQLMPTSTPAVIPPTPPTPRAALQLVPTSTPAVIPPTPPTPVAVPAPVNRFVPVAAPVAPAAPQAAPPTVKPTAGVAPTTKLVPVSATFTKAPTTDEVVTDWCKRVLEGGTPTERHSAIRQVVQFKWLDHPVIASTLLAGAKEDASSVVRVDCIRHLAVYKMNHPQVISDLSSMSADKDSWVRTEATKAVEQLKLVK